MEDKENYSDKINWTLDQKNISLFRGDRFVLSQI